MSITFREYPKVMNHPGYHPAVFKKLDGPNRGFLEPDTVMISPERLAPVTVTSFEQEQKYAAKGYRPANMTNEQEYEQSVLDGVISTKEFQAYPKFKYHPVNLPVIVQNEREEGALGEGWQDLPIAATEDDLYPDANEVSAPVKIDKRTKEGRAMAGQA